MARAFLIKQGYWGELEYLNETNTMVAEIERSNRVHILHVTLTLNETSKLDPVNIPTDYVVAMCADMIGLDSLILQINETQVRIVGVHETTLMEKSDLQHWCRYVGTVRSPSITAL